MDKKIEKVVLVVNPIAGNSDKEPVIEMIRENISPTHNLTVFRTTGTNDIEKLRSEVQQKKPDRILVLGGDGTVKMVAEAIQDFRCSIGILPGGSANGLAIDLDLPQETGEALKTAMGSKTIKMDALKIGDSIGMHISDLGINAELIEHYDKSKIRGRIGYLVNSIPTLWKTDIPYTFTIHNDGNTWETEAIMIAFANSKKFGTGALVNPNGKIDDGTFELLVFKKLDPVEILKTLNGGIEMDEDFVEVIPTTDIKVTTNRPVSFQIDGELVGKVEGVSVSILPAYVEIVVGRA